MVQNTFVFVFLVLCDISLLWNLILTSFSLYICSKGYYLLTKMYIFLIFLCTSWIAFHSFSCSYCGHVTLLSQRNMRSDAHQVQISSLKYPPACTSNFYSFSTGQNGGNPKGDLGSPCVDYGRAIDSVTELKCVHSVAPNNRSFRLLTVI